MNAKKQKSSPAPLVVGILVVLLIGLGVGAFFLFNKPTPAAQVQASPKPETKKETPAPSPAAESGKPKLLGTHDVIKGDTLWWISDKWYKDPILWPSIYEINRGQIKDPDLIFPGQHFDIPALMGSKDKLAPEDLTILSQGYLEAYRVYLEKGKKDAKDYKTVGEKYQKQAK